MQLGHPARHRSLVSGNLALTREQYALEPKLNLLVRLVNGGADLEKTV